MVPESCFTTIVRRCCVGETLETLPQRRHISMSDDKTKLYQRIASQLPFRLRALQRLSSLHQAVSNDRMRFVADLDKVCLGQETNCDKRFALEICNGIVNRP